VAIIWRVGLLAVAVVVCAWFALGAHQTVDTNRAAALIGGGPLSPTQARQAASLLGSARTLNPDLTPDILRGELALGRRQDAAGVADLESVTRREPLDLEAWSALAFGAARAGDRATLVRAAHHISMLFPKLKR
jgi:predicted Zn-dependent protease